MTTVKCFSDNPPLISLAPERVFLICAIIFGYSLVFINPPMQAPDERAHLSRAWQVSIGNFYQGSFDAEIPAGLVNMADTFVHLVGKPEEKISKAAITSQIFSDSISSPENSQPVLFRTVAYAYHPISYLGSGTGLAFGRLMEFSPLICFYFGRIMNLTVWILVVWTGLRISPVFKWEIMFLAMLPMSLFQAGTFSADSFNNAVCFLLICSILNALYDKTDQPVSVKMLALITCCAFAAACGKQIYALLFFLMLCGGYRRFEKPRHFWYYMAGTLVIILLGASWPLFNPNPSSIGANESFEQLTQSFVTPLKVLFFTLHYYHKAYFAQFIGAFGYLETRAPIIIYMMYTAVLVILSAGMCVTRHKISWSLRILSASLIVFFISALIFTLYIIWRNDLPFISGGVQGRYFTPFSLLIPIVFAKSVSTSSSGKIEWVRNLFVRFQRPLHLCLVLTIIIGLTSCCYTIYARYYSDGNYHKPQNAFVQGHADWHCGEIISGKVPEQEFIAPYARLKEIQLYLATYVRINKGPLELELIDVESGDLVVAVKDTMESVANNQWHKFRTRGQVLIPGKKYKIRLLAPEAGPGNALTWYGSKTDIYPGMNSMLNRTRLPGDFAFAVIFDTPKIAK